MNNTEIKVSVMLTTYNHEKYIEQAIKSVLAQKTDFRYELLIGEDCSTDHTKEIVLKYQKLYPETIKVITHSRNIGALRNEADLRKKCKGKYIAVLEGDDYWSYDKKLSMQVDILDKHPEYIGVAHNVKVVGENGKRLPVNFQGFHYKKQHVYTKKNALKFEMIGHFSGWVYRNIWGTLSEIEFSMIKNCEVNADLKLSIVLGLKGKILFLEDEWSVYRRLFKGDGWSAKYWKKNMLSYQYDQDVKLKNFLMQCYHEKIDIEYRLLNYVYQSFVAWKKKMTLENWMIFWRLFKKEGLKKRTIVFYFMKKQFEQYIDFTA